MRRLNWNYLIVNVAFLAVVGSLSVFISPWFLFLIVIWKWDLYDVKVNEELEDALNGFLDCPRSIDKATIQKGNNFDNAVFNASIHIERYRRAQKALGRKPYP